MPRRLIAGGVLALLWLACGLGAYFLQLPGGSIATLARLIPSPMRGDFFGLPTGWAIIVHALAVVLIVAAYAVISSWFGSRATFAAGWLAALLTGFVVGGVLDLGDFVAWVGDFGIRGALGTMGAAPLTVFWALVVGWIPALLVRGQRSRARGWAITVTVIAVAAAIALPLAAQGAHAAQQAQLREDRAAAEAEAQANADPDGAAPRDPNAQGEPVPTVAPTAAAASPTACTAENATIMAPAPDAATGHRLVSLQLVNISDEPCTLDGYPDVAFGDQNDHVLDVALEHGSSFMATDPGPAAIELSPGASARAGIAWDANSVQGQLAARQLWVAPFAGTARSRWDVSLDIVPGATVSVTAWEAVSVAG
ncbi:DUF4232 domain-containing protein [Microbacterium protaetiae]|uniref:DUF4232 domain-containing protein n=1 Tax=Microbacterium protaetiae TaxID=2509458 RepID=A0A4P6ER87_9MICO|nr:DUF4232 domain-containing protein [Microbacterium protaetiae]QAY60408.1 DUF4232 domain-containing protein [Microbacterium protaetiae]